MGHITTLITAMALILVLEVNVTTAVSLAANSWNHYDQPNGSFTSPNYPENYRNAETVKYLISGKETDTVLLNVPMYSFASGDQLSIYDGNGTDNLIGRLLGSKRSWRFDYESFSNQMLIVFTTDSSETSAGFIAYYKINIVTESWEYYNDSNGVLTSLSYPEQYKNSITEYHLISGKIGFTVLLNVVMYSFASGDYLSIYDGNITDINYQIDWLSGSGNSEYCESSSNQMLIVFTTDLSETSTGFIASYKISNTIPTESWEYYNHSNGVLTSLNYSEPYITSTIEYHLITVAHQEYIVIYFPVFNTGADGDIIIYDGNSTNAPRIDGLLGLGSGKSYWSTNNQLLLVFKTGRPRFPPTETAFLGFLANYMSRIKCDAIISTFPATVFPLNYTTYTAYYKCKWKIQAPSATRVKLTVNEINIKGIISVKDSTAPAGAQDYEIARFSGNTGYDVLCSNNEMTIQFFYESFSVDSNQTYNLSLTTVSKPITGPYYYGKETGLLMSPNFPETYPNNCETFYYIKAQLESHIQLSIHEFDLCPDDYLAVYDGGTVSAYLLIARLSGYADNNDILSSTFEMTLLFIARSRDSEYCRGFRATYATRASSASCGGEVLVTNETVIYSPFYGYSDSTPMICEWYITVAMKSRVKLNFNYINLHQYCNQCSKLNIYDGSAVTTETRILRLTGAEGYIDGLVGEDLVASSNKIVIQLITTERFDSSLFQISALEKKNVSSTGPFNYTKPNGEVIMSPNFPQNYNNRMHVIYNINLQSAASITLTVIELSLQKNVDYLFIYDGESTEGRNLKELTGSLDPGSTDITHINGSRMTLLFQTSNFTTGKGFLAMYTSLPLPPSTTTPTTTHETTHETESVLTSNPTQNPCRDGNQKGLCYSNNYSLSGGQIAGICIGFFLSVAIAAAVIFYVNRTRSLSKETNPKIAGLANNAYKPDEQYFEK